MPRLTPGVRSAANCVAASCAAGQPARRDVGGHHRQRHVDGQHHGGPVAGHLDLLGGTGQRPASGSASRPAAARSAGAGPGPAAGARPAPAAPATRTATGSAGGRRLTSTYPISSATTAAAEGEPHRMGERHQASPLVCAPAARWRWHRSSRACDPSRTAARRRSSPGRSAASAGRRRTGAVPRRRPGGAQPPGAAKSLRSDAVVCTCRVRPLSGSSRVTSPMSGNRRSSGSSTSTAISSCRPDSARSERCQSTGPTKSDTTTASPRRRGGRRSCSMADARSPRWPTGARGVVASVRSRCCRCARPPRAGTRTMPLPGGQHRPDPVAAALGEVGDRRGRRDHQVPLLAAARIRNPATPTGRRRSMSPAPGRRPSAGCAPRWCGR